MAIHCKETPFKVIQFPWRLYLIPQVLLAYIVAWSLDQMIKKWRKSKGYYDNKCILLSIIIVVAVICGLQLSEQSTYISSIGNVRVPASTLMNTRDVTKDYYPKAALPEFKNILNHEAVAGKKHIEVTPKGHGEYKFKANRDLKRVQMPFVMYRGEKYRCKVNGRRVKIYRSKNRLLTVKGVKKGKARVHTSVVSNIWESLFKWLLFIVGILWLIWQYFCYKYGDKVCMKFVKKHKEIIASVVANVVSVLLLLIIFIIGYKDSISSKLEAMGELLSADIAFCGLMFAVSIFNLKYNTFVRFINGFGDSQGSLFIVNFVNESRISTSARFLGAFISKNQIKYFHNKNKIGAQLPFPSAESSNKDEESTKYVGTLTNIKAHHSVSFRIYLKEIIHMMNNNDYWNIFMNKIFREKRNITLIFAFIDYKFQLSFEYITIPYKDSMYNEIFNKFNFKDENITNINKISNTSVDGDKSKTAHFKRTYKSAFIMRTNIDILKKLKIN